jgi:hypothetical protein
LNLRWNHLFSDYFQISLIYSDYYYGLDFVGFKWIPALKLQHQIWLQKLHLWFKLNYGVNAIYYDFNPGTIKPSNSESGINFDQLDKKYAFEPSLYVSATQEVSKRLSYLWIKIQSLSLRKFNGKHLWK